MANILVNKYGMTFYTREATRNPGGEQGETEGVIRHLISQGHSAVYYGPNRGDLPCPAIAPDTRGLDTDSGIGEQAAQWESLDLPRLETFAPFDVCVNINGMPPSRCMVDNPVFSRIQQFSIARCAPLLFALQHFEIPRICVNNDPRAYSRDCEMAYMPWTRPRALLDQSSNEKHITIGGVKWRRVSRYAKAESWGYLGEPRKNTHEIDCGVIAHAHVDDGIKKGSFQPWRDLLSAAEIPVWGNGWESTDFKWEGCLKANQVLDQFSKITCSPVVSHTPGFYTGKPYVMLNAGCIPLIYGRGQLGTWDPDERYQKLNSQARVETCDDLFRLSSHISNCYLDWFEYMNEVFCKDFSVLDACVETLEKNPDDNSFGGYFSC